MTLTLGGLHLPQAPWMPHTMVASRPRASPLVPGKPRESSLSNLRYFMRVDLSQNPAEPSLVNPTWCAWKAITNIHPSTTQLLMPSTC